MSVIVNTVGIMSSCSNLLRLSGQEFDMQWSVLCCIMLFGLLKHCKILDMNEDQNKLH